MKGVLLTLSGFITILLSTAYALASQGQGSLMPYMMTLFAAGLLLFFYGIGQVPAEVRQQPEKTADSRRPDTMWRTAVGPKTTPLQRA